jgi:hypothetical protein
MRKLFVLLHIIIIGLCFVGCEREIDPVAEYSFPTGSEAFLKINFASVYRANPNVQISVNNVRVSNLITARTPFPGGGYNTNGDSRPDYLKLNPGTMPVSIAIPKVGTNTDSVNLFTGSIDLAAGKYYSLHITDTAANTKMVLVEDDVSNADTGSSKYRFINLMPNVPAVSFYYGTTLVAAKVPYLSITPTLVMKTPATTLAWTIRHADSSATSTPLATYTLASTTLSTRNYVVFAMGYRGITATTDPRRPFVSFYHTR